VTTIARSHPSTVGARVRSACLLIASLSVSAVLVALLAAAPAKAVVTEVETEPSVKVKVGVQPRLFTAIKSGEVVEHPAKKREEITYRNESGNVVLGATGDYLVYWDPNDTFHSEWVANLDHFFRDLGEAGPGTPFDILSVYRDRSNKVVPFSDQFKGSYSDTAPFPTSGNCTDPNLEFFGKGNSTACLTDAQLRAQLQSFIATHKLPKGMGTVYYLVTPPGTTVCLDAAGTQCSDYTLSPAEQAAESRKSATYKSSFCSYHGDINPDNAPQGDGNTILYGAIPWTAGSLGMLEEWGGPSFAFNNPYDCQDGGWNPEKASEKFEHPRELTKEEEEAVEKLEKEGKTELLAEFKKKRRLEGPHIEEPNQEGKSEFGDLAAALTDVLVNQIGEEQMNIVTDPLLTSWHNASGEEATDVCRDVFAGSAKGGAGGSATANLETEAGTLYNMLLGTNTYYVNNVYNVGNNACEGAIGLVARFTPPDPVNAGEILGVDGMESTVSLLTTEAFGPSGPPKPTYATFSWNFGDGSPEVKGFAPGAPPCEEPWLSPCAASAFHSYQYGGTYKVTLTVTDVGGNVGKISHDVSVNGPPPPSAGEGAGSGSGSSAGPSTPPPSAPGAGAGAGSSTGGSAAAANPVAAAAVISRTLRSATKSGVVVNYSVNEQVAGHFEVLLSRATAKRLHITGPAALGLPAGSPPSIVVAKALVITTKGGRSSVKLFFSKSVSQHLAHQHSVSFLLRLVVRNASAAHPATSTVLSTFTLTH
jgi:hypothetical protein